MLSRAAALPAAAAAAAAVGVGVGVGARIVPSTRIAAKSSPSGVGSVLRRSQFTPHARAASSKRKAAADREPPQPKEGNTSEAATDSAQAANAATSAPSLRKGVDPAGQGQQQLAAATAAAAAAAVSPSAASTGSSPSPASAPASGYSANGPAKSPPSQPARPVAQPYQHRKVSEPTPTPSPSPPPQARSEASSTTTQAAPAPSAPSSSADVISGTIISPGESSRLRANASPSSSDPDMTDSIPSAALTLTTTPTVDDGTFKQHRRHIKHPFNTFSLVHRLRNAGFGRPSEDKGKRKAGSGEEAVQGGGDSSAFVIMDATRHLLVERGDWVLEHHLNKADLENEAYLFSAALAELRTETQVRARNDGAALRSMTTLLQREVDALDLKMREDISMLKHDIQIEMNSRKAELKEGQNAIEQEIQDLHNRFTISLSDLKTEIEQNIKWDATRRSLALVFGIAAIVMTTLTLADILTRDDQAAILAKSKLGSSSASSSPPMSRAEDEAARAAREAGMNLRDRRNGLAVGGGTSDGTDSSIGDDTPLTPPQSAEELGLVPTYDLEALRVI
ncbi:unnamed protein product [Tilletia controversa]|uniref:Mitochondrial protein n=3 Tax=Tilletia TaxID=13289 RepID=A0A8X7MKW0_9BASI|nr:hypothetical protein CF328_g7500 [Tilletia controversa]KAE8186646.1 hypothetical protein CF335_g7383 [Tilletia laevis]KAE8247215.1 hypothetical protein A4X03_0g7110 [Tilletia caries]KAE8188382.1 hypothetical protein CF336_g6176 [Tilletia laevis]KAE8239639.1 hypothetical protein A4X06_0g8148 [Tilletia controversa]